MKKIIMTFTILSSICFSQDYIVDDYYFSCSDLSVINEIFVLNPTAYINNCTGSHHTGIGREALHNLTDGDANTALGRSALKICTSGDNNIGIGAYAGDGTVTTAGGNILIGYNTELEGVGQENEIVIGTSSSGKGSSTGFFNPNGGNAFQGNNSSAWATTSDERIKKNIISRQTN